MNMLKKALALWKSEKRRKGTTLQHRLILFFISVTVVLILSFTLLLLLFGITGKEEKTVHTYFENEISHISDAVYDNFGLLSVDGISMAETISEACDSFFAKNGMTAETLAKHPDLLEPLLAGQIQTLLNTMNNRGCGGVFILLDATVQPNAEAASYSKAGIFLKKTQPTSMQAVGVKNYYLRGPAQIARDNGIELLGQWSMEYDITDEPFFLDVMQTARENDALPLSRLYYWTGRVALKDNSEAGFLLCVPLRSKDGTVFGICGIEVSDRMFKQLYCPSDSTYDNVFTAAAPAGENCLFTSQGMIAGNYYLTTTRMTEDLLRISSKDGFERFEGDEVYYGRSASLRLYPIDSPYAEENWTAAILMPEAVLATAVKGNSRYLLAIVCGLLLISLAVSVLISRRYLRPVTDALDSIRQNSYDTDESSAYTEIADLFDFLAQKDKDHEEERKQLEKQRCDAQTKLSRLTDKRRKEVDPDAYALFLTHLVKLTPKEREIFNLYLAGKSAKEIMELISINENTLKYHNKNIYSKLGVASRKELLLYATLMNQERL